jgi:hypothetical protein
VTFTNEKFQTWWPFALALVGIVASLFWYRWEVARKQELNVLSSWGAAGHLESVRRLSEIDSAEARKRLQALAEDDQATADGRVAAINALGSKHSFDEASFSALLRIEEPFSVRHAAASVLAQGKCGETCVSASLTALDFILQGKPTLEMTLPLPPESAEQEAISKKILEKLHKESAQDYLALLKSNPCVTWKVARRDYADDEALLDELKPQVGGC